MKPGSWNPTNSQSSKPGATKPRCVMSRLRSDIVSNVYEPDTRLKFAEMTKRYDVGVSRLREALSQLSSEGFVRGVAGKGFRVAPVSAEELAEITEHFINFEKQAVREAIEHGGEDWESNIVAVHHRLSLIEGLSWEERTKRHSEWAERHREFHEAIVAACQGTWLFWLRSMMFSQLDRYRFLAKRAPEVHGPGKSGEHRDIMAATLARDADLASELIEQHIRNSSERAMKLL